MKTCPKCNSRLKKIKVDVAGAKNKVISYQCSKCDYFGFDSKSSKKVVEELRETPLKIKQKIVEKYFHAASQEYINKMMAAATQLKQQSSNYKISILCRSL